MAIDTIKWLQLIALWPVEVFKRAVRVICEQFEPHIDLALFFNAVDP